MAERETFDTVHLARRASDWSPAWKEVGSPLGPGAELKSPGESQSLSAAVVGSGLVARGLLGDEICLLAFLLDAQPDLTPACTFGPSPAGLSSPGIHRSPRTRVAELSAGLSRVLAPVHKFHERTLKHSRREASRRPVAALRGSLLPQHPRPRGAPTAMEVLESGEQSVLQWDRKLSELSEPGETEALMYHTVRTRGQARGVLRRKAVVVTSWRPGNWEAASGKWHDHNKRCGDGSFPL